MFTDGISRRPLHETLSLYHGSKSGLQGDIQPHFRSARKTCDFGRGFYMGTKRRQAETLIAGHRSPILYSIRLDPKNLACLHLDGMAWALFVAYNREHLYGAQNERLRTFLSGIAKDADLIAGPIADDRMNYVLKQFFAGDITDAVLLHCMRDMDLGTQYVAVTERACGQITVVDEHALTSDETAQLMEQANGIYRAGIQLVQQVRREYRRTGEYFDDILEKISRELEGERHGTGPDLNERL